jgi:hypothetical protein
VHVFLQTHLLHWLEAMSLMGETGHCVRLLARLQAKANVRSLARKVCSMHTDLQHSHSQVSVQAISAMRTGLCCAFVQC